MSTVVMVFAIMTGSVSAAHAASVPPAGEIGADENAFTAPSNAAPATPTDGMVPSDAAATPSSPNAALDPTSTLKGAEDLAGTPSAADTTRIKALSTELKALGDRATELNSALNAANKAYDDGQIELERQRKSVLQANKKADVSELVAQSARERVGGFARSSYITPVTPGSVVIAASQGDDPSSAARGEEYLAHIGRGAGADLDTANRQLQTARHDRAEADRLARGAQMQAAALERNRADIGQQAQAAATELNSKVIELNTAMVQAQAEIAADAAARAALAAASAAASDQAANFDYAAGLDTNGTSFNPVLCTVPAPSTYPTKRSWGGFGNGLIPESALCPISSSPENLLRWDAAAAFNAMDVAYKEQFGVDICVNNSYRSYSEQISIAVTRAGFAARPGTSNHGWALAADLCGGIENFSSSQHRWMVTNAPSYGWFHPPWAGTGGSLPEAWHWEFGQLS